jgi:hypothetical protein
MTAAIPRSGLEAHGAVQFLQLGAEPMIAMFIETP